MRLGQLARKLSLRPAEIVEFLAGQGIPLEANSNTRMEDGLVMLVVKKYAPDSLVEVESELKAVVDEVTEEKEQDQVNNVDDIEESAIESVQPVQSLTAQTTSFETEVIRVPKIELSGLKVLGKIELAEPKKNELQEGNASSESTQEEQKSRSEKKSHKTNGKRNLHKQKRIPNQPWKNPLELQREQEAKEAEEKRQLSMAQKKEKRKKYYETKAKVKVKPKREKPAGDLSKNEMVTIIKPAPKTVFGKFLRWLTRDM
jgi:hypothetical protein